MDVLEALELRLVYGDCDPAGIVYFAAYLPWMERAMTEWHLRHDVPVGGMQERWGVVEVTRAAACEYVARAALYDPLRCEMRLDHLGRTSYRTRFDFVRTTDEVVVAVGGMTIVYVGGDGRAAPVPEAMRALLAGAAPG